MVFSISVVASLPGLETVTVEATPLQADGRGSMAMLGGGLLQIKNKARGKMDRKTYIHWLIIMSPNKPFHLNNTPLTFL